MQTQDFQDRWNEIRRVADEVRVKLNLASKELRTKWEDDLEPKIMRLEQALEDKGESALAASKELLEDVTGAIRRLRDQLLSRAEEATSSHP
jgi:hypothetical protein